MRIPAVLRANIYWLIGHVSQNQSIICIQDFCISYPLMGSSCFGVLSLDLKSWKRAPIRSLNRNGDKGHPLQMPDSCLLYLEEIPSVVSGWSYMWGTSRNMFGGVLRRLKTRKSLDWLILSKAFSQSWSTNVIFDCCRSAMSKSRLATKMACYVDFLGLKPNWKFWIQESYAHWKRLRTNLARIL